jgi:hypothetical protein
VVDFSPPPPFEEGLHVSPYELFRRLSNGEQPPMVDLRATGTTLVGAIRGASTTAYSPGTILIDEDGQAATEAARRARANGLEVRALYGGMTLWDFALDPLVVGERRFLSD